LENAGKVGVGGCLKKSGPSPLTFFNGTALRKMSIPYIRREKFVTVPTARVW
jgi:hypothetical protein